MDLDRLVFDICGVNITDDDDGDDANGRGGIYGEFLPIFLSVSSTFILSSFMMIAVEEIILLLLSLLLLCSSSAS